jgi:hypothetical protein
MRKNMKRAIPGFEGGGKIRETGIALVHKGEYIVPAEGSEALVEQVKANEETVVNYYFPVEIEIIGELSEKDQEVMEARIWEKLQNALDTIT